MLSSENHSGIFTFLVGMIVVVMAAVGLSIVADKHRILSSGTGELQREISANATEISELSARADEQGRLLEVSGASLLRGSAAHRELTTKLESLHQRQAALENSRSQVSESIATLESVFSRYRANYRKTSWADAIGESLGTLTIRGGRVYQQVTITRVTDVGLEIRHEHGIARIQAPDLDAKMQDRFQWSDEERWSRLEEERKNRGSGPVKDLAGEPAVNGGRDVLAGANPVPPTPQVNRIQNARPVADDAKLKQLRLQVNGWRAKVSKLRNDKMEASSRARYGKQTSVPGSLETWVARSARLGRELLQAQTALAAAKANLVEVAPNDPTLGVMESGE